MTRQEALEQIGYFNNGVYATKGNRWFKVYGTEPDNPGCTVLEAGYDAMPADYREKHDTPEAALDSLQQSIDISQWRALAF